MYAWFTWKVSKTSRMAQIKVRLFSLSTILLSLYTCPLLANSPLTELPVVSSTNGELSVTISLVKSTHTIRHSASNVDMTISTRTFNGSLPGPTLLIRPGDTLNVHFVNNLPVQAAARAYDHNKYSAPDESNLHFHGLYVSGELPSDDTSLVVSPGGDSFTYRTTVPSDHWPGTHWLHPHRHGSTALQVGGGAASAIIVEDTNQTAPPALASMRDVVLVVQHMDLDTLDEVVRESRDGVFALSGQPPSDEFLLVNGQYQPVLDFIPPDTWVRLRVIHAGWLRVNLDLTVPGCDVRLWAKDGITLPDAPRPLRAAAAAVAPGGRADLLVKCPEASTSYSILSESLDAEVAVILTTNETKTTPGGGGGVGADGDDVIAELEAWTPQYPRYLEDLREVRPSEGCSCGTRLDNRAINGRRFEYDEVLHESYLGAVVERNIRGRNHPYHQHVYPFQVVEGFGAGASSGYLKLGDWHDTLSESGVLRYQVKQFPGKVMVHCHSLDHEDQGMMAVEYVNGGDTTTCSCHSESAGLSVWMIVLIAAVAVAIVALGSYLFCRRRRLRKERYSMDAAETHHGSD